MENRPGTIAIFDDDEDILSICSYILEERGWRVLTFTNCENIEPDLLIYQPDVILMDNWIPEQGGIAATKALKANNELKRIPVIYFSANNDISALAAEAGADSYLAKPFDLDDLEKIINEVTSKFN